jgi:hypothetical protein
LYYFLGWSLHEPVLRFGYDVYHRLPESTGQSPELSESTECMDPICRAPHLLLPTPVLRDPTATIAGRRRTPPMKESRRSPPSLPPSRHLATSVRPCPHELALCHLGGPLGLTRKTLLPVGRRSAVSKCATVLLCMRTRRGDHV